MKEVEISEEDLSRDWRIRAEFKHNYGEYCDYYCAFWKQCPTRVKKKILYKDVKVKNFERLTVCKYFY